MKVVRWTNWDEAEKIAKDVGEDYSFDAVVATVYELREKNLKIGGYSHQSKEYNGVPVFDNGKVMMMSFRRWGEIMADAFGGSYVDYAWNGEL